MAISACKVSAEQLQAAKDNVVQQRQLAAKYYNCPVEALPKCQGQTRHKGICKKEILLRIMGGERKGVRPQGTVNSEENIFLCSAHTRAKSRAKAAQDQQEPTQSPKPYSAPSLAKKKKTRKKMKEQKRQQAPELPLPAPMPTMAAWPEHSTLPILQLTHDELPTAPLSPSADSTIAEDSVSVFAGILHLEAYLEGL